MNTSGSGRPGGSWHTADGSQQGRTVPLPAHDHAESPDERGQGRRSDDGHQSDRYQDAADPAGPACQGDQRDQDDQANLRPSARRVGRAPGRPSGRGHPAGRRPRWPRRAVRAVALLIALCFFLLAVVLLVTPSVGNAEAVARADALAHRAPFPGPAVPDRFADALIATEDHRFGSALEPGFDPFAVARVIIARLTGGGDQGGATLYQQLAKLLYDPHSGGLKLYVYEVGLGIKLKFSYSSQQILRMYAGIVYFGHGYYGLDVASCGYFGRQPDRLSWPQAAVLAGLVQAPTAYDPLKHPALARSREGHVLGRLVATGVLTQRQAAAAFAVPISRLVAGAGGCPARPGR